MRKKCSKDSASDLWQYIIKYADYCAIIASDDSSEVPMSNRERVPYDNELKAIKILLLSRFEEATGFKPIESINVVTNEPAWRLENDTTDKRT